MKNRLLIINTRLGSNKEFINYWKADETKRITNPKNVLWFSEPFEVTGNNFKVLIINGKDLPNSVEDVEDELEYIFLNSSKLNPKILENSEIGMIFHGYKKVPDIMQLIPNSSRLVFSIKYSSGLGWGFCEQIQGDFFPNSDPSDVRKGVFDAFRDVLVFNKIDELEAKFEKLWSYFELEDRKAFLNKLKKEESLFSLLENPYYEKYLNVALSEFGTVKSFIEQINQGTVSDALFWKVLDQLPEKLINH
ncbi:MAG: hypothetical protein ABJI69_00880 [Balneola sp.]